MCDPVSAVLAVSAVVGAAGALYQGQAQKNAAEFQAEMDRRNAIFADQRAKDAIERGQLEEEKAKRDNAQLKGLQEASFAAANIDTGYGSPLDVINSTAMEGEMNAAIIRANAEREAEDYEMQAWNSRSNASLSKAAGRSAQIGSYFSAAGTILSGAASVGQYQALKARPGSIS